MGKASSNKKVARAARAGGGRARAAGERNILFPVALVLVVVLGTVLIVYARDNRQAEALEAPLVGDHWHSAYAFDICGELQSELPEFEAPQQRGTHTHGDGLIHIHPFATSRAGDQATLVNWLADAGEALGSGGELSDDELSLPLGETYIEGEDSCEGMDGDPIVQVAIWNSGQAALDGEDPDDLVTEGFDDIRFLDDGQAFTIAFLPEGADIEPPPSATGLAGVGSDLGVDPENVPDEVPLPGAEGETDTSTTAPADDTTDTSTTAPADDTTTTTPDQ